MNQLDAFLVSCNRQCRVGNGTDSINMHPFLIDGSVRYCTISPANFVPDTVRQGYDDMIVYEAQSPADQYEKPPTEKQTITRLDNNQTFFVQIVDQKNPILFTLILTDRGP